jgi:hypothetical protein
MVQRALFCWMVLIGSVAGADQPWSGTMVLVESMAGPAIIGGADKVELNDYAKLLEERLQKARTEVRTAAPLVARLLREDIGTFEAELERVALAGGGAGGSLVLGSTLYTIKGGRMSVQGRSGVNMLIDREHGTAVVEAGGKRDDLQLSPLPETRELDKSAPEVPWLERHARRVTVRAEGKVCQVLVIPDLPNPYALGLSAGGDDKDTIPIALAALPGLPALVEYTTGEVTHRWAVTEITPKPVPDDFLGK